MVSRKCDCRRGQMPSVKGGWNHQGAKRKLLIKGVFVGGKRVFINSLWGQEGRNLQSKFSLCKRLYELVAEIPSKILNSTGKKQVWSYF